ncbi:hypothetical protein [Telluribacter humicola]|uniref:hypothetical protein n=1 Tax=Telluribacter humicola TaxID=1720261 RepID=UPI001A96E57C|nr:hypothetical protein [Telluribacter humicola]
MLDVHSIEEMQRYLLENPEIASLLSGMPMESVPDELQVKTLHYNKPQLRSALIEANEETDVWGRGTGKSEGRIAPRSMRNMEVMPRSRGGFVGRTYLQLLERTIPPVIKGWEAQGYKRGRDFWIREKPPKSLNIPTPIVGPLTSEHTIYHRNGSVASLISQDRPGSANGTSLHWIVGDEAKLLDKQKYDNELMPANRGDERYWKDVPELHSILLATDMPTSKEAKWILEKKHEMDIDRIELILSVQMEIFRLTKKLVFAQGTTKANVLRELSRRRAQWDKLRANARYYSLASTLDNLEGFGAKNLARLKRILPAFIFMTAILNKEPFLTESAFYPDLGEGHLYDAVDYAYVDSVDWEKVKFDDCRKDADLNPNAPLHIGGDYNAAINPIVIGQQWRKKDLKIINSMYVKHPERLADCARAFCNYYKYHKSKKVYYYYDHTATYTSSQLDESPADEFCRILESNGWNVEMVYIGHTEKPEVRFELWGKALRGGDESTPEVLINRGNNEYLLTSMRMARTTQKEQGFAKDKKDEKNKELDQRETTHFSDGGDTLLVGFTRYIREEVGDTMDILTS